jgi:hypothetical protein
MAEKTINDISLDAQEKQLGYTRDEKKSLGDTSALEVVSPGGLRTADVGLSAEQVVTNEDFDRKESTRILRKVDYRLIPLLGFMDGTSGLAGWKWIFLLEGLLPVLMSFFVW